MRAARRVPVLRGRAGLVLFAWAAAALVLPALHLVDHDRPHVHLGGAIVYLDAPEATGDGEEDSPPEAPDADAEPLDDHGRGALSHFAAAFLASGPAPIAPEPLLQERAQELPGRSVRLARGARGRTRARAPPSAPHPSIS